MIWWRHPAANQYPSDNSLKAKPWFERYCDDGVVQCRSEWRAQYVRDAIRATAGAMWSGDGTVKLRPEESPVMGCGLRSGVSVFSIQAMRRPTTSRQVECRSTSSCRLARPEVR